MIRFGFKTNVKGLDRYIANLDRLELVVMATAANIEGDAKRSILTSSGRFNPSKRGSRVHWSSPPGTPPNSDLGNLAASIRHRKINRTKAEVSVGAAYGIPLEIGWIAKNGKHVPARPFMTPAVQRHEKPFVTAIKAVLRGGR